jgi:hypothetical protein
MREEHTGVRGDEKHGDGDFNGGEVNSDGHQHPDQV